jgi:hypothetical protein
MNDKLVRRAAKKFHDWLASIVAQPMTSNQKRIILEELSNAVGKVHEIEKWAERFLNGVTPREQWVVDSPAFVGIGPYPKKKHVGIASPDVYSRISQKMIPNMTRRASESMELAATMLKNISDEPENPVLSLKEAIQEISIINNSWPNVDYRGGCLAVTIDEVSLSDDNDTVYFGKFIISLDLSEPTGSGLHIGAIDPQTEERNYYHPHVTEDGSICAGEGEDAMQEALIQGRLEDYFRIVEAILRTYNASSPCRCQIGTTPITKVKHIAMRAKDIGRTKNQAIVRDVILPFVTIVEMESANVMNATVIDVQNAIPAVKIAAKQFVMVVQHVVMIAVIHIAVIVFPSANVVIIKYVNVKSVLALVQNVANQYAKTTIARQNVVIAETHFAQSA